MACMVSVSQQDEHWSGALETRRLPKHPLNSFRMVQFVGWLLKNVLLCIRFYHTQHTLGRRSSLTRTLEKCSIIHKIGPLLSDHRRS